MSQATGSPSSPGSPPVIVVPSIQMNKLDFNFVPKNKPEPSKSAVANLSNLVPKLISVKERALFFQNGGKGGSFRIDDDSNGSSSPAMLDNDTSRATYNDIYLPEKQISDQTGELVQDIDEEQIYESPLKQRSQRLTVSNLPEPPSLTSEELQAQVEAHNPDTVYPVGYFAVPKNPPRQTVDEVDDDPNSFYINRLSYRDGFVLLPDDWITQDELVVLLRLACKQVVELRKIEDRKRLLQGPPVITAPSASPSRVLPSPRPAPSTPGTDSYESPKSQQSPDRILSQLSGKENMSIVTIRGCHTFGMTELVGPGILLHFFTPENNSFLCFLTSENNSSLNKQRCTSFHIFV